MDIEQFFEETDQDYIGKVKRFKDIHDFSAFNKNNNIKISNRDLQGVHEFVCKEDGLEKLREDNLDMVAGGKSRLKVVDAEAICAEFVADGAYFEQEILDEYCCARCIHKVIAPKTIFFKERITCGIGKGKGYKSPSDLIEKKS